MTRTSTNDGTSGFDPRRPAREGREGGREGVGDGGDGDGEGWTVPAVPGSIRAFAYRLIRETNENRPLGWGISLAVLGVCLTFLPTTAVYGVS